MKRVILIAKRDYLQTVLSKAYLFGLILLPVLIVGGFLAIALANKGNTSDQRVVVIDHTGAAAGAVIEASKEAAHKAALDAASGMRAQPHYVFEEVKPEADAIAQLLALSNRIRTGELFLVLDIPADALQPEGDPNKSSVHYYTNASGVNQLGLWLPATVNDGIRSARLAKLGVDPARIPDALRQIHVVSMNLVARDPASGRVEPGEKRNSVQLGMPTFLVFLLIMIAMFGATPNLGAVAEDKTQRVYEMLLVSASPFELMMGKVVASLGASLTSSAVYIAAGLMALTSMAMFGMAPLHLLPWFFVYLIGDVVILSALGVALGAACGSPQDAQHLAFLLVVPVMVPMFLLTPVMQQPNGIVSTALSLFPPFTPVLMLLRQATPGGVPWWQPWVGMAGVTLCAFVVVWAAARIFRIGILAQGKTPKVAELAEWVVRG